MPDEPDIGDYYRHQPVTAAPQQHGMPDKTMDKGQVLARFNERIGARDVAGARAVIEQAYPALSKDLDIAFLFARVRFEQGRFPEAARVLKPLTVALPNERVVQRLYLDALIGAGEFKTAAEAGNKFLKRGRATDIEQTTARAYALWGKPAPAISLLQGVAASDPANAEALAMLGILFNQSGRTKDAIGALSRAMALQPNDPRYLFDLASLHLSVSDPDSAEPLLAKIVAIDPMHVPALRTLSELLFKTGRTREALPLLTRLLSLTPDDISVCTMYLTSEAMNGDPDRAAHVAEDLMARFPDAPVLIRDLAFIKCRAGDADAVTRISAKLKEHPSMVITALSLEAAALNKAGRRDDAQAILNFDTLVTSHVIDPPDGWPDLPTFNADLTRQILEHPDLGEHATNRSLVNESCTFELFDGKETGAIKGLRAVMEREARAYAAKLPGIAGAPAAYVACMPDEFHFECWANVMRHAGNHTAHFHPRAWLSGVYYPCLPETMAETGADDIAGALEVGCSFGDFLPAPDEPTRAVKPKEGSITLFPSYIGHRTVPVETDGKPRISIAFNVAMYGKT